MLEYFDICGTRIPISSIKDFRLIKVEFIFRPVFHEAKKASMFTRSGPKYEFAYMEPYAAIIGQQGHKSELGEYRAKDFKEALSKDISGGVIYTIADKLKLKAFKRQKYQCINIAGRPFSTYLEDVPAKMMWVDGRIAEVYKEDALYTELNEITTPGIEFVSALVIKANEIFTFYGDGIQLPDVIYEFDRLSQAQGEYALESSRKMISEKGKSVLPSISSLRLPLKITETKVIDPVEQDD